MIDMKYVVSRVNDVLGMLDSDELPNIYNYLSALLPDDDDDDDDYYFDAPYEIADFIIGLDKPKPFPKYLIEFITEMYELEIAEGNENAMNDLGAQHYDGTMVGSEKEGVRGVEFQAVGIDNPSVEANPKLMTENGLRELFGYERRERY